MAAVRKQVLKRPSAMKAKGLTRYAMKCPAAAKTKGFIPQKRRHKRLQRASVRSTNLAVARRARAVAKAKRKRFEKAGVFYTPLNQRLGRVRR